MPRARPLLVLALLVLALSLSLAACTRRGRGGSPSRREVTRLQQQASRELGCNPRSLVITPLSDRVMQVHGCGQLRDYAYAAGRGRGWYAIQPVYARAGAEMACPIQQLTVQAPTATIRQASGCGRTARYDLVCGAAECAWMMTAHGGAWAGEGGGSMGDGTAMTASAAAGYPAAEAGGIPDPGAVASSDPDPVSAADAQAAPDPAPAPGPVTVVTTSGDELVIPEPPAAGSPEAQLRALLDTRSAPIHRCAGVGVVSVRVAWAADGAVSVALAEPLAGTDAERCVRDAVGAQRVAAGAAGEIVHPVR